MSLEVLALEPVDLTLLRGNRRFADTGHGELVMPPAPSVVAGALRSRLLVDAGIDPHAFARGAATLEQAVAAALGTPAEPGAFEIAWLALEREGTAYLPLPADLVVLEGQSGPELHRLEPVEVRRLGVRGSFPLPEAPVLRVAARTKPLSGWWISAHGLAEHLAGRAVYRDALVPARALWLRESRLGIGMDARRRTVRTGLLYTTDAAALTPGTRFLVGVRGVAKGMIGHGLLRLGGDGRGARVEPADGRCMQPLLQAPPPAGCRFRLVFLTPGLSPSGWLPPGLVQRDGQWWLRHEGLEARLVAAAAPRGQVVSGWDLARGQPKPAWRSIPAGAVYWFEVEQPRPASLELLCSRGLWALPGGWRGPLEARRAEGFNNVLLGVG